MLLDSATPFLVWYELKHRISGGARQNAPAVSGASFFSFSSCLEPFSLASCFAPFSFASCLAPFFFVSLVPTPFSSSFVWTSFSGQAHQQNSQNEDCVDERAVESTAIYLVDSRAGQPSQHCKGDEYTNLRNSRTAVALSLHTRLVLKTWHGHRPLV